MGRLGGVMTAMVTPFDAEGRLNFTALPEYLQFQRAAGIEGVVVCGTNGEGVSLTVSERKELLEAVLSLKGDLTVIAGTGAAALPDAVDLTAHAGEAGADAALVLPPFFFKNPRQEGIAAYFRTIMDQAACPVLLYSIPQQTAVPVTDEALDLLADHPRLAGLKDSQGDWARTHALITQRRDLKVFTGSDDLLARGLAAGSAGCISGTANAFPNLVASVCRATTDFERDTAQVRLDAAKTILLQYPLIAAAKSVLANRGVPRMWVRPPLVNLTMQQELEMMSRFEALEALESQP